MSEQNVTSILNNELKSTSLKLGNLVVPMHELPEKLLDYPLFAFTDYKLTNGSDQMVIAGSGKFMAVDNSRLTFRMDEQKGKLRTELNAEFPSDHAITIPGLSKYGISKLKVDLSKTNALRGYLEGIIQMGKIEIPIKVMLPAGASGWFVVGNFSEIALPGLSDLVGLFGDEKLVNFIPAPLDAKINLHEFELLFDPKKGKLHYISGGISIGNNWEIIPDALQLEQLRLNLSLMNPASKKSRSSHIQIQAITKIAGASVPVTLEGYDSIGSWSLYSTPDIQTPSMAETLALVGAADAAEALPDALKGMSGLSLSYLGFDFDPSSKQIVSASFGIETAAPWEIVPDTFSLENIALELEISDVMDSKNRKVWGNLEGTMGIFGSKVKIEGEYDDGITLGGSIDYVNLTGIVEELIPDLNLPPQVPDIAFKDMQVTLEPESGGFSLQAKSADPWVIPLGFEDLSIENLSIYLQQTSSNALPSPAGKDLVKAGNTSKTTELAKAEDTTPTKQVTGAIGGTLRLGTISTTITYKIPGRFMIGAAVEHVTLSELISSICGPDILQELLIPAEILGMEFRKIGINIAPQDGLVSFVTDSDFGTLEFMAKQGSTGWNFVAGLAPPDTFKFSAIDPALAGLDDINMSGTALIIASSEDRSLGLTEIKVPNTGVTVKPGVNLFANFETAGTGVDEVLGLDRLQIYAVIGAIEDMVIQANIEGEFLIAEDVYLRQVTLAMRPSPIEIKLYGTVSATINKCPLVFTAGLEVSPNSFTLEGSMIGKWQDPFGAKGIAVENLGLEMGVTWPPPLPTVAFAGKLYVGEFEGELAVKFNAAQINNSMLVVNFNYLHICDVLDAFVDPAVSGSIPPIVRNEILDLSFNDVDIYIVPTPTTIANIAYKQGIRFGGEVNAWGFNAILDVQVDYTSGIYIYAEIRPFDLGGILQISGADGPDTSAIAEVDLRLGKQPFVYVTGKVSLLGASSAVNLIISEQGFQFTVTQTLFDLFETELFVAGGKIGDASGILVRATMRNDLFEYLRKEATAYIDKASKDAVAEIEKAKKDLKKAQNDVNRINTNIEAARQRLYRYRIDYLDQLIGDRTNTRNRAIAEMNKYQRQYDAHLNTIKAQREKDTRALNNARNDVTNKKNALSSLQTRINTKKNQRDQYRRDGKYYTDKMWATSFFSPDRAKYEKQANQAKGKATGLDIEIVGLEIEKTAAEVALSLAQGVLDAIIWVQTAAPITADPKLVQLSAFVEANRLSRDDMSNQIKNFNNDKSKAWQWVDANMEVLALIATRDTALAGLRVAEDFLATTQDVIAFSADVAKHVVEFGLGGLIDIRYAIFEGRLTDLDGGHIMLGIGIQFMGGDVQDIGLSFNFGDKKGSAKQLGQQLLSKKTAAKPGSVSMPKQITV